MTEFELIDNIITSDVLKYIGIGLHENKTVDPLYTPVEGKIEIDPVIYNKDDIQTLINNMKSSIDTYKSELENTQQEIPIYMKGVIKWINLQIEYLEQTYINGAW